MVSLESQSLTVCVHYWVLVEPIVWWSIIEKKAELHFFLLMTIFQKIGRWFWSPKNCCQAIKDINEVCLGIIFFWTLPIFSLFRNNMHTRGGWKVALETATNEKVHFYIAKLIATINILDGVEKWHLRLQPMKMVHFHIV